MCSYHCCITETLYSTTTQSLNNFIFPQRNSKNDLCRPVVRDDKIVSILLSLKAHKPRGWIELPKMIKWIHGVKKRYAPITTHRKRRRWQARETSRCVLYVIRIIKCLARTLCLNADWLGRQHCGKCYETYVLQGFKTTRYFFLLKCSNQSKSASLNGSTLT